MIAKNGPCVYIQRMNMSKQPINFARICASLILGFTQISFAATAEPTLLDIPPPPSLKGPSAGAPQTSTAPTTGNKMPVPAVGTSKVDSSNAETARSSQGAFGKANNSVSATSTQSDNANAVNAATEAARRAAIPATPTGVLWINQVFPIANTMYSSPQSK